MEDRDWCRRYIVDHCIERSSPGHPLISSTGKHNAWQLFLRRGLYNAQFAKTAGRLLCDRMQAEFAGSQYQIAGMESGAVPLLVVIGQEFLQRGITLNVFSVRKEPKPYGLFNHVEGVPRPGLMTLMVDDFVHSGASLRKCNKVLRSQHITVLEHAFCLVGLSQVDEITVHSLFSLSDIGLSG